PEELSDCRSALLAASKEARLRAIREADREGFTWAALTFHADHKKGALRAAAEVAAALGHAVGDDLLDRFGRRAAWGAMLAVEAALRADRALGDEWLAAVPPAAQGALLREVFGNPTRPPPMIHASLSWGAGRAGKGPARAEAHYRVGPPASAYASPES